MNTRDIGGQGERIAIRYLKSKNYKIYDINWYCYAGEIDIIAFKDHLVFVEVKYVPSGFCLLTELFNYKKKYALFRSIKKYLEIYPKYTKSWSIDLITIDKNRKIDHYEDIDLLSV